MTKDLQILTFSKDEQETVCRYDYLDDCWYIETNVIKHINLILKKYEGMAKVTSVNEVGKPTSVRVTLPANGVAFRKVMLELK